MVMLFYDFYQFRRNFCEPLGVRFIGIILSFPLRFVGVVVSCHAFKQRMHIRVVGIINFVANAPHNYRGVIPISEHHLSEIAFVPFREIFCISIVFGRIYIVEMCIRDRIGGGGQLEAKLRAESFFSYCRGVVL